MINGVVTVLLAAIILGIAFLYRQHLDEDRDTTQQVLVMAIAGIAGALTIIAAIALLRRRSWARICLIINAVYLTVIATAYYFQSAELFIYAIIAILSVATIALLLAPTARSSSASRSGGTE